MHIRDPLHHHVSVKHELDAFQALALSLNVPVRLSIYIIQQSNDTSLIGGLRKKKKLHPMQNISATFNQISSAQRS